MTRRDSALLDRFARRLTDLVFEFRDLGRSDIIAVLAMEQIGLETEQVREMELALQEDA